jgi:RNA-directed DNA polymerase
MPRISFPHSYEDIISIENLLEAWKEFVKGKRSKTGVKEFSRFLMKHVTELHEGLKTKTYVHGGYEAFKISDPKPRDIHKATVRDRLLHHAIYRQLYPFFDRTFITDSYSCRKGKGTHRAMDRFQIFARKVSKNNTQTCWVLKCDIRKFFASIDQRILLEILREYIPDRNIIELLEKVIQSFSSNQKGKGLPLGNLTSQLLVNIYMNEFDQFAKHQLKVRHYIRYADDFVVLSDNREWLESLLPRISSFLMETLTLELHPKKVSIGTHAAGIDFLGWVHFPDHQVLRTVAKRRMKRRIRGNTDDQVLQSYLGLLQHGNSHGLAVEIVSPSV